MMSPQLCEEGYILLSASKHMASKINRPATASPKLTEYFLDLLDHAAQSSLFVLCNHLNQAPKNWATLSSSTLASNLSKFSGISNGAGRPTLNDARLQALKSMGQSLVTRSSAFSQVSSFNNDVTTLSVERGSEAICAYAASTAFSRPWTVDGPDSLRQEFACW